MIGTSLLPGSLMPQASLGVPIGGGSEVATIVAKAANVAKGAKTLKDQLDLAVRKNRWSWDRSQDYAEAYNQMVVAYKQATGKAAPVARPTFGPVPT